MTTAPDVSVVIPTHDRPRALKRALGALSLQREVALEVIVVNDGGPEPLDDVTAEFSGTLDLRLLRQRNAGPAAARNLGAESASAPVLAFTDDDCAPRPGWAAALAAAVADETEAPRLVGGRTRNGCHGNLFSEASQDVVDYVTETSEGTVPFVASNNVAMPRGAFAEIGGFDPSFPLAAGEDRAFCRAWARRGWPIVAAPAAVVDHYHRLGPATFWRQHLAYGRGARRFHDDSANFRPLARLGYYGALVAHPVRRTRKPGALLRSGLVAVAQVATVAGFALEGRQLRAEASAATPPERQAAVPARDGE